MPKTSLAGVISFLLTAGLFCPAAAFATTPQQDEQYVRSAYATVGFLCGVRPVTNAAYQQLGSAKVDPAKVSAEVQTATPIFELSNFSSGSIESIKDRQVGDFITQTPGQILKLSSIVRSDNDNGNQNEWPEMSLSWSANNVVDPEDLNPLLHEPIGKSVPANITRYVAYTVNIVFQGKSTGAYRAIFFFANDPSGKEIAYPRDLVAEAPLNQVLAQKHVYPAGLLKSRLRETPVVEQWIAANRKEDSSCSPGSELCCTGNECGIRDAYARRDLALPLPEPKH